MKNEYRKKQEAVAEYEKRNEEIVNKLLKKELTTRETLREMNKSLGSVLIKLSEIKA